MGKLQRKIDKLSDNDFIMKYVYVEHDDMTVKERRLMYKMENDKVDDDRPLYSIAFEYTVVKNPGFFNSNIEVAKKTLSNFIYIDDENEANLYMEAMEHAPYIIDSECDNIEFEFMLKQYAPYHVKGTYWKKSHFINLTLRDNKDIGLCNSWSLKVILKHADDNFPKLQKKTLVKTVDMNDIVNISNTKISQLNDSINEIDGKRTDIVLAEIERTKNYLMLLNSLL